MTAYDLADPEVSAFYATPAFHEKYWGEAGGFGPTIEIATAPGHDPAPAVERVISEFELPEVFVGEQKDQTEKVEDGTRVLAVGLTAFAAVAALAALVAGAQALHRRMAETGGRSPHAARHGPQPNGVHDRDGPVRAADHRGRCGRRRGARDRRLRR